MKKSLSQYTSAPIIKRDFGTQAFQDDVKTKVTVLPELKNLIPPLLPDEYKQLEENILREGCREPLLIWNTTGDRIGREGSTEEVYVLIDGHNRYGICQTHKLDFNILFRQFDTLDAVRDYMIDNQLGRRNLTPEQMSYLRGLKYLAVKKSTGGDRKSDQKNPVQVSAGDEAPGQALKKTKEVLAEQFGVSARTILNDASFAKGLDKLETPLKNEVLSRRVRLNKQDIVALGELTDAVGPVSSPEQLGQVIGQKGGKSPEKATRPASAKGKKSGREPDRSALNDRVNRIAALAVSLKEPSAPLLQTCEALLAEIQQMIERLKEEVKR